MSNLSPSQVAQWCETLYVNIPDISKVNALRDAIRERSITGKQFDSILHSNRFRSEFIDIWPEVSPITAVLIRKLWHTDFYPKTKDDSWRVHHLAKNSTPGSLQLDEVADVVEHIVDVMTPSCNLNRDQIYNRINPLLPQDLSDIIKSHPHEH